jgi:hypothetical protein
MDSSHQNGRIRKNFPDEFQEEDNMCGCMLMHAMMNHQEHQPGAQAEASTNAMHTSGQQHCAHCGFPLQPGFAFCPGCGMSLKTAECPACGQKVDPGWRACAYCGSPLGEVQGTPAHH